MNKKKIFVIAGEISGDLLGGRVMRALKAEAEARGQEIEFAGIGGSTMKEAGLESLMPMEELCVMGLVEVLEHLPRLMKLIRYVAEEIEAFNPDAVLSIDLPDFNFRVAQLLKKRGQCSAKLIHYTAPTVWAWREKRAQKIAQFLDGLLCLFPFEPQYFTPHGLDSIFVGHPIVEKPFDPVRRQEAGKEFRERNGLDQTIPIVAVMFGSRSSEFSYNKDHMLMAMDLIREQVPDVQFVIPTLPHMYYEVLEAISGLDHPSYVILEADEKERALLACNAAMAVSGTVALELAYDDVPHVITYRTNWLTAMLIRFLIKIRFAHLVNIILDKEVVPEFIQGKANADNLTMGVLKLLKSEEAAQAQRDNFALVRDKLCDAEKTEPSVKAARYILDKIK